MNARGFLFFSFVAAASLFAYAKLSAMKAAESEITVALPKGYSAPTAIPKDSWEDRMKQIMVEGLESEALAGTADSEKPVKAANPNLVAQKAPAKRTLSFRTGHTRKARAGQRHAKRRARRY